MWGFFEAYKEIIILVGLFIIFLVAYTIYSYHSFNKQRASILTLQNSLAVGDEVILSSGFYATIAELQDTVAIVQLNETMTAKINRYSISAKK